jgi:hypothetical protein
MATLATVESSGNMLRFTGGVGVNANDVVVQTGDISRYDTFMIMTTAGAAQILASLDGTNYGTAPLSLTDMGATTSDPVIVTAANRIYRVRGKFSKLKVTQNGATAVTAATLICSKDSTQN